MTTTQIAVRLPAELIQFIDNEVRAGRATSRAGLVASAVERERRREQALQDVRILLAERGGGAPDGLDELAGFAAGIAPAAD